MEPTELISANMLTQPAERAGLPRVQGNLQQSDVVMRDTFFIGVYPGLTDEMLDFVLDRFSEFFRSRGLS